MLSYVMRHMAFYNFYWSCAGKLEKFFTVLLMWVFIGVKKGKVGVRL